MEKVHRVDDQRDVGRVLSRGVGELLMRDDGVLGKDVGPRLQAGSGEIPVYPPDAGLAQLGDFLEQPIGDAGGCIVGIDQHCESG